jgi:hypothetical protein
MDGSGWVQEPVRRDRGGRFVAGVSGNPAGKRKGTPNRLTMLKPALSVDESDTVARAVIDRALAGDMIAARLCFEAILPKARSRPIELDLPACGSVAGIVAAFDVTVTAMAAGEITPDEALKVTRVLNARRRALASRARELAREARRRRVAARREARVAAARPAENAASETPTIAPAIAEFGADLHPACTFSSNGPAGKAVEATDAAPSPQLPELGSSCIHPAISRPESRHAGPIDPDASAMDRLHSALPRSPASGLQIHDTRDRSVASTRGRTAAFNPARRDAI